MREQSYLVTGGAGFIGSHVAELLLSEGHRVRVLDDLSQGRPEFVPSQCEFMRGTVVDLETCRAACDGIDGVFHLAAMSKVGPSIDKIEFCTEQNILGTQNLLIAARDEGVSKVVYSGSSTYYGSQRPPHSTDLLPQCLNPYAMSKYVGEQFCELFTRLYGLPTVSLRYFNVYGPRQPRTGAYALVLGIFLEMHASGRPLVIHGDGNQERDFVHVRDVARANLAAMGSSVSGRVFNVGSGTAISIKQLADMISPHQEFEPRREGDAEATLADISDTVRELGWRPGIEFEDGLAELVATGVG